MTEKREDQSYSQLKISLRTSSVVCVVVIPGNKVWLPGRCGNDEDDSSDPGEAVGAD